MNARACGSVWMSSARAAGAAAQSLAARRWLGRVGLNAALAPPPRSARSSPLAVATDYETLPQTMNSCAMYKITYVARKKQVGK